MTVKRGAKDAEPSFALQFSDDKFGVGPGGYNAEIFSDYIALDTESEAEDSSISKYDEPENIDASMDNALDSSEMSPAPTIANNANVDDDPLLSRKGVKFSLRGPISTDIINQSTASAVVERTSTRTGKHETIGSATLGLGPTARNLPLGARASLAASLTSGARFGDQTVFPYSSASITSRQLFPLFTEGRSTTSQQVNLALEHTVMGATNNIPRHEANAAGIASRVRGYEFGANGPIDSSISGTAEIRVPVIVPIRSESVQQDGSLVFFGDWVCAHRHKHLCAGGFSKDGMFGKSSVGVGFRKSFQGIPLKFDVSLTKEGKVGTLFTLGRDWMI